MPRDCTFPNCACAGDCQFSAYTKDVAPPMQCTFPTCRCTVHCGGKGKPTFAGALATQLAEADGEPCPYCSFVMDLRSPRRRPTRDYVQPLARGGANVPANIAVVCAACASDKGGQTLGEWFEDMVWRRDARAKHVSEFSKRREARRVV